MDGIRGVSLRNWHAFPNDSLRAFLSLRFHGELASVEAADAMEVFPSRLQLRVLWVVGLAFSLSHRGMFHCESRRRRMPRTPIQPAQAACSVGCGDRV